MKSKLGLPRQAMLQRLRRLAFKYFREAGMVLLSHPNAESMAQKADGAGSSSGANYGGGGLEYGLDG